VSVVQSDCVTINNGTQFQGGIEWNKKKSYFVVFWNARHFISLVLHTVTRKCNCVY